MSKKFVPGKKAKGKVETCYCGECVSYKELTNIAGALLQRSKEADSKLKETDQLLEQNRVAMLAALKTLENVTENSKIEIEDYVKVLVKEINKAWNNQDKGVN